MEQIREVISEFRGEHFFLSNFYDANVKYNGVTYKNNEAAFQSMKCPQRAKDFAELNPSQAKALGRQASLRSDWETVKEEIMYAICVEKFKQNADLMDKLLLTYPSILIEGNNWNDKEWGMCNGEGKNKLGKILMSIRDLFKEKQYDNKE